MSTFLRTPELLAAIVGGKTVSKLGESQIVALIDYVGASLTIDPIRLEQVQYGRLVEVMNALRYKACADAGCLDVDAFWRALKRRAVAFGVIFAQPETDGARIVEWFEVELEFEKKPRIIVDNQEQAVVDAVARVLEAVDLDETDTLYVNVNRTIRLSDDESEILVDWDVRLTTEGHRHDMTHWGSFDLDKAGRDDQSIIAAIGGFECWESEWDEDDSFVLDGDGPDVLRDAAGYPRTKAEIARALGDDYEDEAA